MSRPQRVAPDQDSVRAAVSMAVRAPSLHNTQPWRWRVGGLGLQLHADRTRHLPATDPTGADLLLSCGAALHHLRVGFAALGWGTTVRRFPDTDEPDHLATVEFLRREPTEFDLALAAAIPRRRTDRRRFSSWPVPPGLLRRLVDRAAVEGVLVRGALSSETRATLVEVIAEAARTQAADPACTRELHAWSGKHMWSPDGVPSANIPWKADSHSAVPAREFAYGALIPPLDVDLGEDASVLLMLSTSTDDRQARLRAGEAMSAVLLDATSMGLATCPISQPMEVGTARELVRTGVLRSAVHPQVVLRVGWAAIHADRLPPTRRRPIDDVLEYGPR